MVKFFRDTLDGPLYIVLVILSIILIMAIIGFIMERKQKEKEAKGKVAFVDRNTKRIDDKKDKDVASSQQIPVFNPNEKKETK